MKCIKKKWRIKKKGKKFADDILSSLLIILSHFSLDIVLIKSLELKDGLETIERISPFLTSSTTIDPE